MTTALPLVSPAAGRDTPGTHVAWFGASSRLVGGHPDTRYGWLAVDGGPCIIKALDSTLTAYAATLLQHERRMLARLAAIGAPAPALVDTGRDDWLVTRFAGLTLQRLARADGGGALDAGERLAVWVHLLRRLEPLAARGVLLADLYAGNVVVPLTQGTAGQLRLHEPAVIDHAHTLEAGMDMRRPVWLAHTMRHIAPELRDVVRQDQQQLQAAFSAIGADLPGYSELPVARDRFNRKAWAEYDAPQRLQALLDAGGLDAGRAMQFAAGTQLLPLLDEVPAARREGLRRVVGRMTSVQPNGRFPSLAGAADALADAADSLPLVSRASWGCVGPADLAVSTPAPPVARSDSFVSEVHTAFASPASVPWPPSPGELPAPVRKRRPSWAHPALWCGGLVLGAWLGLRGLPW